MDAHTQKVLDEFARDLDRIEKTSPMIGSYSRIAPEIIECEQAGHRFRYILFHVESKSWFGQQFVDGCLVACVDGNATRPDDVVVDLGCNSGYMTVWFALQCPDGHVHAFDPYPWNTASAKAQAALNRLTNISVHNVGIGNQDRTLRVPVFSSKTFNADKVNKDYPEMDIVIRDTEYLRKLKPNFVKIDIEGAEQELASSTLADIPTLRGGYVEMHPPFIEAGGGTPSDFLIYLKDAGFDVNLSSPTGTPIPDAREFEVAHTAYFFHRQMRAYGSGSKSWLGRIFGR